MVTGQRKTNLNPLHYESVNTNTHTMSPREHSPEALQFVLQLGLDGCAWPAHFGQGLRQLHLVFIHGCGAPGAPETPSCSSSSPFPLPLPPDAATHVFVSRCDTELILLSHIRGFVYMSLPKVYFPVICFVFNSLLKQLRR